MAAREPDPTERPRTPAMVPAPLAPTAELPPGLSEHARALGAAALARVAPSPRELSPRMRAQTLRPPSRELVPGLAFTAFGAVFGLLMGPIVGASVLGFGVTLLSWSAVRAARRRSVMRHGVAALATVEAVRFEHHRMGPRGEWVVEYAYVVRGERHDGSSVVEEADARELQQAGVVPVVYDPAHPDRSAIWLGALDLR